MELSNEDNLRLNVLIKQDLHAIRIDESRMTVHALTGRGEAKVALNPTCRDDKYLRMVREMFSTHALGSPGGYPVYLRRWTRMGEMREESLQGLLLLGEPEAIVAVANSPKLNEAVARRAWWAMPESDIARRMLKNPQIAGSEIGKQLAEFLIEYLPFETEAHDIVESVSLVLQPGLIADAAVQSLWSRASRKSVYYIGFLSGAPFALPQPLTASSRYQEAKAQLEVLSNNPYAQLLIKLLSPEGQTFLATIEKAIHKLSDQHVTVLLLNAIQDYFQKNGLTWDTYFRTFKEIAAVVAKEKVSHDNLPLALVHEAAPGYDDVVDAMLGMSCVSESLADPIFSQTDAVGSVMRKRLHPVTQPILEYIQLLLR